MSDQTNVQCWKAYRAVLHCAAAFVCWSVPATLGQAQEVDVYVSSQVGDRLAQKEQLSFESAGTEPADFQIDDTVRYQEIIGFGASFLEAGLIGLNSLPAARQERVLRALFDPKEGAGFSAMKTVIGATDFSSAGPFYTYNDTPGDVELKNFSISRDLGPNGLVTYIKRAQRYGDFTLQATMDYPPDWMLIDDRTNQNVDPKHYRTLANYYLRYVQEYEKQGIAIDYLSPFNEPGVYTKIRYAEIRNLLKDHIGPLFAQAGIRTRLQVADSQTRKRASSELPVILDDPDARKYISSISYHGYDYVFAPPAETGKQQQVLGKIVALRANYPDLPLWMTEVCYFEMGERFKPPGNKKLPVYDFEDGDFWGRQIVADIAAGASGWTYWNMILDQNGGPALVSPQHGNPEHNVQHPVVIINRQTNEVTYTGLYYYLAHFSKFVRPGAFRIKTSGSADGVTLLGFVGNNGRIVSEMINSLDRESEVTLQWNEQTLNIILPARSISTYRWRP